MVPQHSFVCLYIGQIYDAAEHEKLVRPRWWPLGALLAHGELQERLRGQGKLAGASPAGCPAVLMPRCARSGG